MKDWMLKASSFIDVRISIIFHSLFLNLKKFKKRCIVNIQTAIDGKWGEWSVWSEPKSDSNQVKRTRKCDNPSPLYNGKDCDGSPDEVKDVVKREFEEIIIR